MLRATLLVLALLVPAATISLAPGAAEPEPLLPGEGPLTLLSIDSGPALVDEAGNVVHAWVLPHGAPIVADKELLPNGNLLMVAAGVTGLLGELSGAPTEWPAHGVIPDPIGSFLFEIDMESRIVWSMAGAGGVPFTWLHDADYLEETDTFLIADTTSTGVYPDRVIEIDRDGNVLWAWYPEESSYPNDADRLPNGNVLVSLRDLGQIVEVNRAGEVVWSFGGPGGPLNGIHNPDRLPNGNTIVADSNNDRIVEVNHAGEIVWEYGDSSILQWPRDADVLPNGNVLIADSTNRRVIEVNRAKEIVWSFDIATYPANYDVDRINEPPTITIREPAADATVANPVRFDATAADPSLAGATYRIYDVTAGAYVDATSLPLPAVPWTRVLDVGHEYRLEVTAWDAGGEGGGYPQDDSVIERAYAERAFSVA